MTPVLTPPLQARHVMTQDVMSVGAHWPLTRLAEFFIEHGISGAPVVDEEGALLGVVSLTDLVRHDSLPQREAGRYTPDYYLDGLRSQYAPEELNGFSLRDEADCAVADIMTPVVFSVTPTTSLAQVADMMTSGRIHRVFVVEERRIVGIISALDLLAQLRKHIWSPA